MRVIRIATLVTAAALGATWAGAGAATASEQPGARKAALSTADAKFLDDAYDIHQGEILLGQLAQQNGMTPAVKDYGQRMISDHGQALADETQAAGAARVGLPSEVDAATRSQYDELSRKTGHDFDVAYADAMVSGHEKAVGEFGDEAANGTNDAVRAYAQRELPMLREHLRLSRELAQSLR